MNIYIIIFSYRIMFYLINEIEKAKVLRILSRRIRPQLGKVVLFWSDQSNLWSEANENFQNFLFCQFISRFILSLKMMITFGNEELLADGREKLPRIIDIARPTRLTTWQSKALKYLVLAVQALGSQSHYIMKTYCKYTSSYRTKPCCRELAISTVTAVNQGANNAEGDNGAHVHIAVWEEWNALTST